MANLRKKMVKHSSSIKSIRNQLVYQHVKCKDKHILVISPMTLYLHQQHAKESPWNGQRNVDNKGDCEYKDIRHMGYTITNLWRFLLAAFDSLVKQQSYCYFTPPTNLEYKVQLLLCLYILAMHFLLVKHLKNNSTT